MNGTQVNSNVSKFNRHIRKKKSKRVVIIVLTAVLLAVAGILTAAGMLSYNFLKSSPETTETCQVPELNGVELSDAEKLLEQQGLTMRIIGAVPGRGSESTVVWQSTAQGESMPRNGTIEIWIQRAKDEQRSWADAEITLEKLSASDISCAVEYICEPMAADNLVINVDISGSDAVVCINRAERIEMPDLHKMTESEAAELLDELGLAFVKNVKSDAEAEKGEVIAQYPEAGQLLKAGDTVLLTVCFGAVKSPVFSMSAHGETAHSLTVGQSVLLSVDISPEAATLNQVQWSSSDISVAKVDPTGKVTAVGEGNAVITAHSEDGKHTIEYNIRVTEVYVGMELVALPDRTEWLTGDQFSPEGLKAVVYTSGGEMVDITDECAVKGADLSRECTSTVTVEYIDGLTAMSSSFEVICCEPVLEINAESVILGLEDRHTLHTVSAPSYAEVKYRSSNESIATVSEDGVITGHKTGSCTITAEIEGKLTRQCSVSVKSKIVYLTFDDGPNAYTDDILACLEDHEVKATFFCVGNTRYKKIYKRIADEGHAIGLHSYTHDFSKCYESAAAFMKETEKLQNLVYECTGEKPMIIRFPGGTNNTRAERDVMLEIRDRVLEEGYSYFDWNCYSHDTSSNATARTVADTVLGSCFSESEIVLMHNKKFTCDALDLIIPALKRRGYTFKVITLDTPPIRYNVRGKGH